MLSVMRTNLALPNRRSGKVRDMYDLPAEPGGSSARVLMVATDRISAFDVVMPTPIPGKGRILTSISARWFQLIEERGLARTHVLGHDVSGLDMLSAAERRELEGRSTIARRCQMVPVECVVRGYLDGSGWVDYQRTGRICGVALPPGLRRGDKLPAPIFTPATKEQAGTHDENIDFERACTVAGGDVMRFLRDTSVAVYLAAHEHADERGMILADTKFEFGRPLGPDGAAPGQAPSDLVLADEVLTPDSSRYWNKSLWKPGGEQASYDKQFLRDYLNALAAEGKWDKRAPGPQLPPDVVAGTLDRYEEAERKLGGAGVAAGVVSRAVPG